MDVARMTMVVVSVMIVIGHGGCYNITSRRVPAILSRS